MNSKLKDLKLKTRVFFLKVLNEGEKYYSPRFMIYVLSNPPVVENRFKFAILVKREFGNCVKRNRIKRLIREFVRVNQHLIKSGIWFIIKPKNSLNLQKFSELENEFKNFFKKNKLFKDS